MGKDFHICICTLNFSLSGHLHTWWVAFENITLSMLCIECVISFGISFLPAAVLLYCSASSHPILQHYLKFIFLLTSTFYLVSCKVQIVCLCDFFHSPFLIFTSPGFHYLLPKLCDLSRCLFYLQSSSTLCSIHTDTNAVISRSKLKS